MSPNNYIAKEATGRVKEFLQDRGFGFITWEGEEIFFHISNVAEGGEPQAGDNYKFDVVEGDRGPKALNLIPIEDEKAGFLKDNVLELDEADYDKFCDVAKDYAQDLKEGELTTSKIRKVYSRIMNTKNPRELKMLRPQFAYTAGRAKDEEIGVKDFMDLLDYLAREMNEESQEQLDNFKKFMEAVVAYRKYFGDDE